MTQTDPQASRQASRQAAGQPAGPARPVPGPAAAPATRERPDFATRVTKSLLGYGVIAGPIYVVAGLAQAMTRHGFSLAHDLSILANGSLGWIQMANLMLAGAMSVAAAVGMRHVLRGAPGGSWGPALLGLYGVGLVAAGVFRADPSNGFPPGTPAGKNTNVSWHGMLHIISGGIGFLGLIAACMVIAHYFTTRGERRLAVYSRASGLLFLAGFIGIASGSGSAVIVVAFEVAVVIVWTWISATSVYLYRHAAPTQP